MTAVARFAIDSCPMLLADVLVSGPPASTPAGIALPTVDDTSTVFDAHASSVPYGLRQKIAIVADNLAVGWAGSYAIAREVIGELMRASGREEFTNDSLQKHFDLIDPSVWSEMGLVGFVRDSTGLAGFGRGQGYKKVQTQTYGQVGLLGTGAPPIHRFLQRNAIPGTASLSMNALQQAIAAGLTLSGTFLYGELASRESLQSSYGAGYEIAVSESRRFQKLDDVSYLFWKASVHGRTIRIGQLPLRVFRYTYNDDLLIIRTATFDEDHSSRAVRHGLFRVPPVYRDLRYDEKHNLAVPSLNAKWLCNYIWVQFPNDRQQILALSRYQPNQRKWIQFIDLKEGVGVAVEKEFLEEAANEILKVAFVVEG